MSGGSGCGQDVPQIDRTVYAPWSHRSSCATPKRCPRGRAPRRQSLFRRPAIPARPGQSADRFVPDRPVVLTESEARRIFGTEKPMGRTLTMVTRGITTDYRVTGIARDVPHNSHAASPSSPASISPPVRGHARFPDHLGLAVGLVLFHPPAGLRSGGDPGANAGLGAAQHPRPAIRPENYNPGDEQDWRLANIRDIHLGEAQEATMTPGNDRRTIVTFAIIAFLILGMACVNFTNLATARASQRAREVALRKVLGANRQQLITQFLAESVLIAGIAMLLALAMVELLLPALSNFLDADLAMHYFGSDGMLLPILRSPCSSALPAASIRPSICPASSRRRCSRRTSRRPRRRHRPAPQRSRRRPVRGVDRPHHLHRGRLRPDRLCPDRRSRLPPRRPDPDRESRPPPAARRADAIAGEMARVPGVVSVGRSGIGIATQNNNKTGVQVPGQAEPVKSAIMRSTRLLPDDGHRARRRPAVRPEPPGRRLDHAVPADADAASGRWSRAASTSSSTSLRRGGWASATRPTRSARPSGSAISIPRTGWCRPHHRRRPGFPLPVDPRADRSDHVPL